MARRNSTLGRSVLDLDIDDSAFHSKLSGAYKAATQFTEQAGASLIKAGKAISGVGDSMTRNITVPLVAAGGAVTHFALDFDTTMRRIVALAKVPAKDIDGVRASILKMAADVGRSPQDLGEAFYFVASAGFKADEAMKVLEISAKASAAGMGQVQDVAKVLGGVINAYGHENITAARAGDVLTAAVQDGAAEAADFAGAIGQVVPTAAALGVSFDQVTAAMSAMTNVGIDAATASTNLSQIFSSLLKPTSQAEDALKGVGLTATGLRQELREKGLLATLRTLQTAFEGNDTAIAAVFGNIRALRGVNALLSLDEAQLTGIFNDTSKAVGNLGGAYKDTEGPQREIDRQLAKLQGTAIELGRSVLPLVVEVLSEVADAAGGLGKWWKSLDKGTQDVIVRFLAFVAITGPLLAIVGRVATGLGMVLKVVGLLTGAKGLGSLATQAGRARLMMFGWLGVILGVTAALEAASGPVSDFFDTLTQGKKANKTLHDLNALTGDMLKAGALRAMGIDAKGFAKAIEAAGGDAEAAFNAIKDAGGDLGKALDQLALDADPAKLFSGWGTRDPTKIQQALDDARKNAAGLPTDMAATLVDGKFEVAAAAQVMVDPIDEAVVKEKQAVADAATDLIHTLATTLAGNPKELQDAAKAMWEEILHPFPDIKRRAEIEAILASSKVAEGLHSKDAKTRADTAEFVKGLMAQYELMAPGALAAGNLVNPALQKGIDANFGVLTTYLETTTGTIVNQYDLADELERMGFAGLAGYIRGLADQKQAVIDTAQGVRLRAAKELLIPDAYKTGYDASVAYAKGLRDGGYVAVQKVQDYTGKIAHLLTLPGSPEYFHATEAGEGVVTHYIDGIVKSMSASIRAVDRSVAKVGDALTLVPPITMPAMPGLAAVDAASSTAGWSGATASATASIGGDTYNLNVTGTIPMNDSQDAIRELRRLAGIRV